MAEDDRNEQTPEEEQSSEELEPLPEAEAPEETVECEAGTLVTFDPGERHALRGLDDARLLLTLAPWPAAGHNAASETTHDQHLPANATVEPLD